MEILKTGVKPEMVRMHFTCTNCKTEFVEDKGACTTKTECFGADTFYVCDCPVCEQEVLTKHTYGLRK